MGSAGSRIFLPIPDPLAKIPTRTRPVPVTVFVTRFYPYPWVYPLPVLTRRYRV